MNRPSHFMTSDIDGALYDTRGPDWMRSKPVRTNYRKHCREIRNLSDLKAVLRAGRYTDLGGYPLYFILEDGESASFEGVRQDWKRVVSDMIDGYGQFRVIGSEVYYEGPPMFCSISGKEIESAYGDPDELDADESEGVQP
jgi:hypothetical protein